jgi:UDP-N-acetylmuramate--alanine ligase
MNGAVMKNFASADAPLPRPAWGSGEIFVSEVDESDGSIALYRPRAVLNNVSLDHKSLEELRVLFGNFLAAAPVAVLNADDAESLALAPRPRGDHLRLCARGHDRRAVPASWKADQIAATVIDRRDGSTALALAVPAATTSPMRWPPCRRQRRGAAGRCRCRPGTCRPCPPVRHGRHQPLGVTVIDDFGHNPEKVAATLATLKAHPGRVLALFQPHGYGPLRQMGAELAEVLATRLDADDRVILTDPVYFGGTVDRTQGSERIVA